MEHDVAAVGSVKSARLYHHVVGGERTHASTIVDSAKQVVVARAVLEYDRSAVAELIVDQVVNPIACEEVIRGLLSSRGLLRGLLVGAELEHLRIRHHVGFDFIQKRD